MTTTTITVKLTMLSRWGQFEGLPTAGIISLCKSASLSKHMNKSLYNIVNNMAIQSYASSKSTRVQNTLQLTLNIFLKAAPSSGGDLIRYPFFSLPGKRDRDIMSRSLTCRQRTLLNKDPYTKLAKEESVLHSLTWSDHGWRNALSSIRAGA